MLHYSVIKSIYSNVAYNCEEFDITKKQCVTDFLNDKQAIKDYIADLKFDIKIIGNDFPELTLLYNQTIRELTENY